MNKERVGSSETPPLCCEFHCSRETRQEIGRVATGGRIAVWLKRRGLIGEDPVEMVRSGTWTGSKEQVEELERYLDDRRMTAPEVVSMTAGRPF